MTGTVSFYNPRVSYGFIKLEDGTSLFVHRTSLPKGVKRLKRNSIVTCERGEFNGRPVAINVEIVDSNK